MADEDKSCTTNEGGRVLRYMISVRTGPCPGTIRKVIIVFQAAQYGKKTSGSHEDGGGGAEGREYVTGQAMK